jgi:hypothetical protein
MAHAARREQDEGAGRVINSVAKAESNCSGPLTSASTTSATDARTVGNSDPRFLL